jgi:hypothetical protein
MKDELKHTGIIVPPITISVASMTPCIDSTV